MERPFDYSISSEGIVKSFDFDYDLIQSRGDQIGLSQLISNPVFVVGSPRSGTTVLGNVLSLHDKIGTGEESLFLLHLFRIFSDLHKGDNRRKTRNLSEYIEEDDLLLNMQKFSDSIMDSLLQRKNKDIYLDHTPWYGSISGFIKLLYSDSKFIHIIRDGRQVVRSLGESYNKGFSWAGQSFEHRVKIWVSQVQNCSKMQQHFESDYLEVYYNTLHDAPLSLFNSIFCFLGLENDNEILDGLSINYATPVSGITKEEMSVGYDNNGWPLNWTSEEIDTFYFLASDLMEEKFGDKWDSIYI